MLKILCSRKLTHSIYFCYIYRWKNSQIQQTVNNSLKCSIWTKQHSLVVGYWLRLNKQWSGANNDSSEYPGQKKNPYWSTHVPQYNKYTRLYIITCTVIYRL